MKVVHFAQFAPNRSGLYETARQLAEGQREVLGWDARMVDVTGRTVALKQTPRETGEDRGVPFTDLKWAAEADVHFLHTGIPQAVEGQAPTFAVLHGTPEYTFYSQVMMERHFDPDVRQERAKRSPQTGSFTLLAKRVPAMPWVRGAITFWERHVPFWEVYYDNVILANHFCDTKAFAPEGPKYEFTVPSDPDGLDIVFIDHWRHTAVKDPFQIAHGAVKFCQKTGSKLHLCGIPKEWCAEVKGLLAVVKFKDHAWNVAAKALRATGAIGELHEVELNGGIDKIHRAADLVISPAAEDNRTVLEALACGTPVLARAGAKAATWTCDFSNPNALGRALKRIQRKLASPENVNELRQQSVSAAKAYSLEKSVESIATGVEEALNA